MKSKDLTFCEDILKGHKFRVTPGRVALLLFLKHKERPLSVPDIQKHMPYSMDKVTLYRALEDFVESKIVTKVSLRDTMAYYEFIHTGHHHHHIVCEKCGKIEDIESCNQDVLQKEILKSAKLFKAINSHSLEFFGICKSCEK